MHHPLTITVAPRPLGLVERDGRVLVGDLGHVGSRQLDRLAGQVAARVAEVRAQVEARRTRLHGVQTSRQASDARGWGEVARYETQEGALDVLLG